MTCLALPTRIARGRGPHASRTGTASPGSPSRHLEVETYTWDVLPEEYRREDIVSAVARELNWVRDRLVS
jgi:hypothetical protein